MEKYSIIRKTMYEGQFKRWSHVINIKSPYTLIKSVYYMETASFFLFITQKFIKSPNFITALYFLTGVIGSILLNSSHKELFYIGIFMVFTKGTFDWSDGSLARRLNKTSFIGHSFDTYSALVNDSVFRVAFVYYTLGYYPDLMFLFPIVAFTLLITKFSLFSDSMYYKNLADKPMKNTRDNKFDKIIIDPKQASGLAKCYYRFQSILDPRARSIDFLLLILIIDETLYFDVSGMLLFLSVIIILRALVSFLASFYYSFQIYKN